jgi:UDP-N-acetylmuramoyl-tripeptide--D-alanyl-D-alanine ligase
MSEILWTASEVATAVKGKAFSDFSAAGVSIDTRKIAKGDLFVALQGPNFDGHNYIAAALKAGAAGVIAHRLPDDVAKDAPIVLVQDTLQALQDLGAAARDRSEAKFIAVTGSVGKTSTKEALKTVLSAQLRAFASEGNLNNHWGAPLSLARMPRGTEIGIFELGMNHADEIRPLAKMVRPHVAIITTVEAVHIEFFDSVEGIADAKAEILEGLEPGGVAVLPRDNAHFARMAERAAALGVGQVISFGSDAASDVRLLACETLPDGNRAQADVMGQRVDFETGLTGRHQAINALAVLAAVKAVGAHIARAAKDMAGVKPLKGRGYREEIEIAGGSFMLMDESYNASPAAMRAAFAVLAGLPIAAGGRRIAILGDMRELGKEGPGLHRGLKDDLVAAGIDVAYLTGPLMAELFALLPENIRGGHTPDSLAMAALAPKAIKANDIVLVKGSLGTRMAPIVEAIRDMDINSGQRPKAANGNSRG